jgi:hypothetical protein
MEPRARYGLMAIEKLFTLCRDMVAAHWSSVVRRFLNQSARLSKDDATAVNPCEHCRGTFSDLEREDVPIPRAIRLDQVQPNCRCEEHSVSEFSSGPVANDEVLVRLLVSPFHMQKKKALPRAAALTDAERGGLSTFREKEATKEQIRTVAESLVKRARLADSKAGIFGVLKLKCSVVRDFCADGDTHGSYCVYDTALRETTSHAEIFQRVAGADADLIDDRRNKLFASVKSEFVHVSIFEDGLLLDLAPET